MSGLTEACAAVLNALKPLAPEERARVVKAVMVLLEPTPDAEITEALQARGLCGESWRGMDQILWFCNERRGHENPKHTAHRVSGVDQE